MNHHNIVKIEKKPHEAQSPLDDYKCTKCGKVFVKLTESLASQIDVSGCLTPSN
jgi:transposase-like protein